MSRNIAPVQQDNILQKIHDQFKRLGVVLSENTNTLKWHAMPNSITNQFYTLQDVQGGMYLLRVNGKLWPPFTRGNEAYNLSQLQHHKIETNVLFNDSKSGFQICKYFKNPPTFSRLKKQNHTMWLIAATLKRVHEQCEFENVYPVHQTLQASVEKSPLNKDTQVMQFFELIFRMMKTLYEDQQNYVSSHNDLLPSSIYWQKGQAIFVDWEYSAKNHRTYDLAQFAISASLTPRQEENLLHYYDPQNKLNLHVYFQLMKSIVSLLNFLWKSSLHVDWYSSSWFQQLRISTQTALTLQAANSLIDSNRLRFFHSRESRKRLMGGSVDYYCLTH